MSQWQPPGAPPPVNPYGGGYAGYEPGDDSGRTDGISLAAFICSLTCCAAPVGIGLGIAGLVRTKGGRRRGRWAAVTGLTLGSVITVFAIAFMVFAVFMGSRTVFEDEARVGQCIDIDFLGDPIKAHCDETHAGEVIWTAEFDADLVSRFRASSVEDFCAGLPGLAPKYRDAIESGSYEVGFETDSFDEDDPDSGDLFFCYVERTDGNDLDHHITGTDTGSA